MGSRLMLSGVRSTQMPLQRSLATRLNTELGYDRVNTLVKKSLAEHRALLDIVIDDGALSRERATELLNVAEMARGNRPVH